jgi:hypothetical protein
MRKERIASTWNARSHRREPIRMSGVRVMVDGVAATLEKRTTLRATVDFDKRGKQIGFIQVPHSVHDDAWGVIRVPIAVISNGSGPTVVLEGGNHGDEYEGPIVLGELIRTLDPGAVSFSSPPSTCPRSPPPAAPPRLTTSTSIARFPATILALQRNRLSRTSTTFCFPWPTPFSICIREARRLPSFPAPSSSRWSIQSGMRATRLRRLLSARR